MNVSGCFPFSPPSSTSPHSFELPAACGAGFVMPRCSGPPQGPLRNSTCLSRALRALCKADSAPAVSPITPPYPLTPTLSAPWLYSTSLLLHLAKAAPPWNVLSPHFHLAKDHLLFKAHFKSHLLPKAFHAPPQSDVASLSSLGIVILSLLS